MLTKENLKLCIENSELLDSIFQIEDPNEIANRIQLEINTFINTIAPQKILQFKKDHIPYYTKEILEDIQISNLLLEKAIKENNLPNWREFKNDKAILNKKIESAKSDFFEKRFDSKSDQWNFLKTFNNSNNSQQIPNNITHEGSQVTSSSKIANIANIFFKNKIRLIRESFTKSEIDPMKILSHLIPRCDKTFSLPHMKVSDILKIISSLNNSNSVGHDNISNKIIKK